MVRASADDAGNDLVAVIQQESEAPAPQFLKLNLGEYRRQLSRMQAAAASALHAIYMFALDEGDEDGAGPRLCSQSSTSCCSCRRCCRGAAERSRDSFAWLANEYMPGGKPASAESVVVFLEDLRDIPYQVFMEARGGVLQPAQQTTRLTWKVLASTERRTRNLHRRCEWLRRMIGE